MPRQKPEEYEDQLRKISVAITNRHERLLMVLAMRGKCSLSAALRGILDEHMTTNGET